MSSAEEKIHKKKKRTRDEENNFAEVANVVETEIIEDDDAERKRRKKEKKEKRRLQELAAQEAVAAEETSTAMEVVADEDNEEQPKPKKDKKKKDKKDKHEKAETPVVFSTTSSHLASINNHYVEHPATAAQSTSNVDSKHIEWNITIHPSEEKYLYKPITNFEYLTPSLQRTCQYVLDYIRGKKFTQPTPIQAQCWPALLQGRDVIGIAATGSGKTLAFLIPALLKLSLRPAKPSRQPAPRMLVLAPTRELAMQSQQVIVEVGGSIRGVCIYGGVAKSTQRQEMAMGVDIVVATPGRLLDLMQEGALSLHNISYLVLDEADRMLDEGFEPAIAEIISQCPAKGIARQTVMFSATWPESIRVLAEKYLLPDVLRVTCGSEELSANHRVTQIVEVITSQEKDRRLLKLLEDYHKTRRNKILIFVLYKKEAADLQARLASRGFNVTGIHGDKAQAQRTQALEEFKSGAVPLLIATDVAARGLDIPQVEYVINYSFPLTVEDYVHRIGRTGRGGATGVSHTFFTDFDKGLAGALVGVLQEAGQVVPESIYQFPMMTKKKTSKLYGDFGPKNDLAGKKATKITFD